MTRANVVFVTTQGKFKFQANSSAYPSNFGMPIFGFMCDVATRNSGCGNLENGIGFYEPDSFSLSKIIESLGLSLGSVGYFSYVYEFDFVKCTFKVWENKLSWVNAPADWKERGWNCWIGKNGKYGWTNWVKGKKIFDKKFREMIVSKGEGFYPELDLLANFEKL